MAGALLRLPVTALSAVAGDGETPLHEAARANNLKTAALPVARGVDIHPARAVPAFAGHGRRASRSISTRASRASPVTPTHVRAGRRSGSK